MLLVEALLQTTGTPEIEVAEIDLNNLSALLEDEKAYAREKHYDCYLDRLRSLGINHCESDSTTCPQAPARIHRFKKILVLNRLHRILAPALGALPHICGAGETGSR